jgi:hypothetical protein
MHHEREREIERERERENKKQNKTKKQGKKPQRVWKEIVNLRTKQASNNDKGRKIIEL